MCDIHQRYIYALSYNHMEIGGTFAWPDMPFEQEFQISYNFLLCAQTAQKELRHCVQI
jgi:hypothetical protein